MQNQKNIYNYKNPMWPSDQPTVVMPPGSNTTSLGMPNTRVYTYSTEQNEHNSNAQYLPNQNEQEDFISMLPNNLFSAYRYLTDYIGRFIKINYLFGNQFYMEKSGLLKNIGENYLILEEFGSKNLVFFPFENIKVINFSII